MIVLKSILMMLSMQGNMKNIPAKIIVALHDWQVLSLANTGPSCEIFKYMYVPE